MNVLNSSNDEIKSRELYVFDHPVTLASKFADLLMDWISIHQKEVFHLAISGGSTPNLLFAALAEKYKDNQYWKKVHFWWVDERMVAPDHRESNFGTVEQLLFSKIELMKKQIHRIKGELEVGFEVDSYTHQIQENLDVENGIPRFDLVLLGMGEDGHTASIFPNQMHLLNSKKICEIAIHPLTGQKRITLTGSVINQADKICFLVTGENKARRIAEIWNNLQNANQLPAYHIEAINGTLLWFLDSAAFDLVDK
jgi:6-phosphogluconolactonase